MRFSTPSLRALLAAGTLTIGAATASQAAVLYSFEGTSVQNFFDAGKQAISELTYLVKWSATFDDFVTVGGYGSPSKPFDSCSITLQSYTSFAVTKKCGDYVTLSHDTTQDGAGFSFYFPDYSNYGGIPIGGADSIVFAAGAFAQVGSHAGAYVGNLSGSGVLKIKDLSIKDPGPEPQPGAVPVPAAFPLLAGALGAFGLLGRRRRA